MGHDDQQDLTARGKEIELIYGKEKGRKLTSRACHLSDIEGSGDGDNLDRAAPCVGDRKTVGPLTSEKT